MSSPIYLSLATHRNVFSPGSLVKAIQSFWGLLRELDSAVSRDPHGTVTWAIQAITMESPLTILFMGQSRVETENFLPVIQRECVEGLQVLTESGARRPLYSDAAITRAVQLARLQTTKPLHDRIDTMSVHVPQMGKALIRPATLEHAKVYIEPKYESIGSIVGSLDSITVHAGNEFRVWEEVSGDPVTCKFPDDMLEDVKAALKKRVLVYGNIRASNVGKPLLIEIEGFESYPAESELPSIDEMSGLVQDFTGGRPLKDYIEEIRNA